MAVPAPSRANPLRYGLPVALPCGECIGAAGWGSGRNSVVGEAGLGELEGVGVQLGEGS